MFTTNVAIFAMFCVHCATAKFIVYCLLCIVYCYNVHYIFTIIDDNPLKKKEKSVGKTFYHNPLNEFVFTLEINPLPIHLAKWIGSGLAKVD